MAGRLFMIHARGFTLIELMVAISITAVLGTLGIAGFSNYNKAQVLQTSASEVVTMLNLAKSRAQSQIKPDALCSSANSNSLDGYTVVVVAPSSYQLVLNCSNGIDSVVPEQIKKLPANLSFSSESDPSILFPVQKGGAQVSGADDQFVISDSGEKTKTIKVNALGGISIQ